MQPNFKDLLNNTATKGEARQQHELQNVDSGHGATYGNRSVVLLRHGIKSAVRRHWIIKKIVFYKPPTMFDPSGWKSEMDAIDGIAFSGVTRFIPYVSARSKENLTNNDWFIFKDGLYAANHTKLYIPWQDMNFICSTNVLSVGFQIFHTPYHVSKAYKFIEFLDVNNQKVEEDTAKKSEVMKLVLQKYKLEATHKRIFEKIGHVQDVLYDKDPERLIETMLEQTKARLENSLANEE